MKRIIFSLILAASFILLPTSSFADECMEGDCENGTGTGYTEEGKIYSGEWKDGLPHGMGKMTISKGKHIEGRWEKGQSIETNNIEK